MGTLACRCPQGLLLIHHDSERLIDVDLRATGRRANIPVDVTFPFGRARAAGVVRKSIQHLNRYFIHRENPFLDDAFFSTANLTAFTLRVILGTRLIPLGEVVTYTEFARMLGLPAGARRAVGAALGRNPFPIFYPCHRIVGQDGPGGFSGGRRWKRALLEHEGVTWNGKGEST